MTQAERINEHLTPEQRRERLRAFADRMLIALEDLHTLWPDILPLDTT
ncbi:hypothetical protein [Asticcacaulis sp. AND118]|nr:hypothetical protein [Asticcacaulis sp. AND118]UDF04939.1 hypothetical protein LH365_16210 [Asticcacaulis sp. AND118]